jgi:hypothetical protein
MSYWKITSEQGQVMGIYEGDDPEEALASMQEDGGIPDDQIGTVDDWHIDEAQPEELLEAAAEGLVDDAGDALREARNRLDLPRWKAGKLAGLPTNESSGRRECEVWKNWESRGTEIGGQSSRSLCQLANAIRSARDGDDIDWGQVAARMAVDLDD